jgi:hypothetical protein
MLGSTRIERPLNLVPIDVINVAWIVYVLVQAFTHRISDGHNYLSDPILAGLLTAAALMNLNRWRSLSRQPLSRTCFTGQELYAELRRARDEFPGAIKYSPRLAPSDTALQTCSSQLASEGPTELRSKRDALRLALRIPYMQSMCLFISLACGFYLWHGELPSFAVSLSSFWPALALTLVAAAGMLVQSTALLLFIVLFD